MPDYKDQMNNVIRLEKTPERIISIVPSQTELLFDLGLDQEIVGLTNFCIHPKEKFLEKTRIGGTKKLRLEKIEKLSPDLIIANKEENQKEQVEYLQSKYPVWVSDIKTLDDAYSMMESLGEITKKKDNAQQLIHQIKSDFKRLTSLVRQQKTRSVAYFIWKKPWMVAANNTFIQHLLEISQLRNVFIDKEGRYPEVSLEEIAQLQPDFIFLSSEPYPFKEKDIDELKNLLPKTEILLVDGELFSWYGSRLKYTPHYIKELLF